MKYLALTVDSFFLMMAVSIAASPVSISTLKRFSMAPIGRTANIVLVIRIEKHDGNRGIEVSCDGVDGGIYVSSGKSLEGNEDQKTFDFTFNLMPATYRCEAILKRKANGKTREFKDSLELTVK